MKERVFNPRRLDVPAFAKAGGELQGHWPLGEFKRLQPLLAAVDAPPPVRWAVSGHEQAAPAAQPQPWLRLGVEAELPLTCQRCLQPLSQPLSLAREFQFVPDEAEAERLDGEVEHEVLVASRDFDLRVLVEDELLLDWPLVPRHAVCPQPLAVAEAAPAAVADAAVAPHPFAALAALKRERD
jgi:uncharacterized protein